MEINFKQLLSLLEKKEFEKGEDAKIKDDHLIFVLGNTMAGKSTIVNYFLDNIIPCTNPKTMTSFFERKENTLGPEIGHSLGVSLTKCVSTHKCQYNDLTLYFCDFPGFLNSDQLEESIVLSLGVQYLMKNFKSFFSILIVISEDDFSSARASCFKELLNILNGLFTDLDSIRGSFMFLFNKSKHGKSFELCEELAQHFKNNKLLELILSNRENCAIMNLTTQDSKQEILENLSKRNQNLPIELLNFNNYDKCLGMFNKEIERKANELNELFKQEITLIDAFNVCIKQIDYLNDRKQKLDTSKEQLKRNLKLNMTHDEYTRQEISIEDSIKNFKEYQNEKKAKLTELESSIKADNELLNEIDNPNPVELKYDEIDQNGSCFGMIKWSKKEFLYNNLEMPFLSAMVKYNHQDGKLKIKENNGQLGKYRAIYKSHWDKPAKAELVLNVESQYYNHKKISKMKNVLAKKDKERNTLISNLNEYENKINEQYEKRHDLIEKKRKFEEMNAEIVSMEKETITVEKDISFQILEKNEKLESIKGIKRNIKSQDPSIKCINLLLQHFDNSYANETFQLFRMLYEKMNEHFDKSLIC